MALFARDQHNRENDCRDQGHHDERNQPGFDPGRAFCE
jgi:hypothetical protein